MIKIRHNRNCVGYRVGNVINIHPDLLDYDSDLFSHVLCHELDHDSHARLTVKDIMVDIRDMVPKNPSKLLGFMVRHPRTFLQYIPISVSKDYIAIDLELILIIILTIMVLKVVL